MMDMNDTMGRCMDAMGSMTDGGMVLLVLLLLLLVWVIGLAVVGAVIFWGIRKLSGVRSANT